jgi:hypothetical protein
MAGILPDNLVTLQSPWREVLAEIFLVRPAGRSRLPLAIWLTAGALSVTVAIVVALRPGHLGDLVTVRGWLHYWLSSGDSPYQHFGPVLDYPPMAFLLLWPLDLPPAATMAYWFLPGAVVLTTLAALVQLRWVAERLSVNLSGRDQATLVAMVLAGGGARTSIWLGQTMALSMLFGALAMLWSRRRPWLAALCLALCSFKLHIAAGFGLAILVTEGVAVPLTAGLITLAASWVFAATFGESLASVGSDYVHNLLALYGGPNRVRGLLSIRGVLSDVINHRTAARAAYFGLAGSSLITIVVLAKRRASDAVTRLYVIALCLLWSLSFLPHQLYNILLASPALYLLMWPESGLVKRRDLRALATAAFVLFGVLDVARVARVFSRAMPESDWLFWVGYDTSPLRPFALFVFILWRLYQRPARKNAEYAHR